MRAQGQTVKADKFEKAYTDVFAGVKTFAELKEMEWQDIYTIGNWALNMLEAKPTQDLIEPPQTLTLPTPSPLAAYVSTLKRRGAAVLVNEKYRHLL